MRLLVSVISLSISCLLTVQFLPAQSVPKGLDPTVQVFPVEPNDLTSAKPANLTRINSPAEAEVILKAFGLMPKSDECPSGRAIILHTAEWLALSHTEVDKDGVPTKTTVTYRLEESQWSGFSAKFKNGTCKLSQSFRVDKNPLFYGYRSVNLIAIDYFESDTGDPVDGDKFLMVYKVSTTAATPQNEQDLGTLVSAILGLSSPGSGGTKQTAELLKPPLHYFTLTKVITPTSPPPYTINVSPVLQPGDLSAIASAQSQPKSDDSGTPTNTKKTTSQNSATAPSQPVDCSSVSSSKPCTFTRNFPVDDKEYWDVSLGLAIPGPKENVFKASSTGGVPTSSLTTHTDAYAFADFYPFAYLHAKQSLFPHFNGGVPITSQTLHRPYVGMAEDISGWAQRHGFPVDICVFGGLVFMKQQLYDATAHNQLRTDWAHKVMYGVEVPISSITGKLKGSKSKSGS